jgi:DNA-binding HxlR family transcriptional regulator
VQGGGIDDELTPLGDSLLDLLSQLKAWAEEHMQEVDDARATYDAQQE